MSFLKNHKTRIKEVIHISESKKTAPAKPRKATIIMAAACVVLLAVVCVFGYLLLRKPAEGNVLNNIAREEAAKIKEEMSKTSDDNNIVVSMATIAIFPDGKSPGKVDIDNLPMNNFDFTVAYNLVENEKTVIQTGLIPVGTTVSEMKLLEALPKGEYPASAIYTTYDSTGKEVGKVGVAVTILVQA